MRFSVSVDPHKSVKTRVVKRLFTVEGVLGIGASMTG